MLFEVTAEVHPRELEKKRAEPGYPCPMCGMTTTFALMEHLRPLDAALKLPFGVVLFSLTVAASVRTPRRSPRPSLRAASIPSPRSPPCGPRSILRLGRRIQPGPVLKWASVLLCVMAEVFVGKGLRSLQEAGIVPIHALGGLRLDLLGIFPTAETLLAQLGVIVGLVVSAWWPTSVRLPQDASQAASK